MPNRQPFPTLDPSRTSLWGLKHLKRDDVALEARQNRLELPLNVDLITRYDRQIRKRERERERVRVWSVHRPLVHARYPTVALQKKINE